MVKNFKRSEKKEFSSLLQFLKENRESDFYLTEENKRVYINEIYNLKKLLNNSIVAYTLKEDGDYVGISLIWKAIFSDGKSRHYLKISSKDLIVAEKLLKVLVDWNYLHIDIYAKISKRNKALIYLLYKHKFNFLGDRGSQLLLYRPKNKNIKTTETFKEKTNERFVRKH